MQAKGNDNTNDTPGRGDISLLDPCRQPPAPLSHVSSCYQREDRGIEGKERKEEEEGRRGKSERREGEEKVRAQIVFYLRRNYDRFGEVLRLLTQQ